MIGTVIIDDEIWVCQLIKNIVDWEEMGFQILGEAYNGTDAFELIQAKKPELVLTDIRMSGMDGIELMEKVRKSGLDTKFIVVSGYSDFEYAQSALKYGALGYLLKPVDREELKEFLLSIRSSVFLKREEELLTQTLRERLSTSVEQLKSQYFVSFLTGDAEELKITRANQEYECHLKEGAFQAVVFAFDLRMELPAGKTMEQTALQTLKKKLGDGMNRLCHDILLLIMDHRIVMLLNFPPGKEEQIREMTEDIFEYFVSDRGMIREFDITASCGPVMADINGLRKSFERAENGVLARIKYGKNRLIDLEKYSFKEAGLSRVFPVEREKKLISCLEVYDSMGARELLKELFGAILKDDGLNPALVFDLADEAVNLFVKTLHRNGLDEELMLEKADKVRTNIRSLGQADRILTCINRLIEEAKSLNDEKNQNKSVRAVEVIKQYVEEHYREEISLKEAAEIVCLNPKYLGELFCRETGLHFSEYLIRYRLDLAKELLKDVRFRVGEVGERVGYTDTKHFSKLFRKYVGVTPMQYKKMFS